MSAPHIATACTHCGECSRACAFLSKYALDLEGFSRRPDLAYHCFLCGACSEVCPENIDGRRIALDLRKQCLGRTEVKQCLGPAEAKQCLGPAEAKQCLKPYRFMLAEKQNYVFKNHRRGRTAKVFFPGCSFSGFLPRTTRALTAFFRERGIGVVFDCCAKPVWELGLDKETHKALRALQERLSSAGVREIIVACPNCYDFLHGRIDMAVVDIYTALAASGFTPGARLEPGEVFLPCPDRCGRVLLERAQKALQVRLNPMDGVQCCGLGGGAAVHEPALAQGFRARARQGADSIYTYCASCAVALNASPGKQARHILTCAMGIDESPRPGPHGLLQRALFAVCG